VWNWVEYGGYQEDPFIEAFTSYGSSRDYGVVNRQLYPDVNPEDLMGAFNLIEYINKKKVFERLEFSEMLPSLIRRYCFFEGPGLVYRVDPVLVARTFGLIQPMK